MKITRNLALSFDDVLLEPQFSDVLSRENVDISTRIGNTKLKLGIISANMDSVTGPWMAKAMIENGAMGCLHRFWTIEQNVEAFRDCNSWVSIGIGEHELERAKALYDAGAKTFIVDVAHGASMAVVNHVKRLRSAIVDADLIVGNFATARSIYEFKARAGVVIDGYKVGIGGGSACTTRVVTGCGLPTLHSVIDCSQLDVPIIADGGIRNCDDFAKAIAAGASAVMMGRLLAGCDESCAEITQGYTGLYDERNSGAGYSTISKRYRGSASAESYEAQGKMAEHRTPEGDSFQVPYSGPVKNILQQFSAGLRSSLSYVGASTLDEFREKAVFNRVTEGGRAESFAHGKSTT